MMSNRTYDLPVCPKCGHEDSLYLLPLSLCSILLCVLLLSVLSLLVFTYHMARLTIKNRRGYVPSHGTSVDEGIVQDIKHHFDEAYYKIPDEYLDQKVELDHDIQRLSLFSSASSSSRRRSSLEAIDTMLGMMVNPDACQKQRRQSMDVQDAISMFRGERRRSSTELMEFSHEAFCSSTRMRRRSSVFGGNGRRSSFLELSKENNDESSYEELEKQFGKRICKRSPRRRSSGYPLCTTGSEESVIEKPKRSISFPE